jgi:hypothetical protein
MYTTSRRPPQLGYVVAYGEALVANKTRSSSTRWTTRPRARVPQDPPYDEDRMPTQLICEEHSYGNAERWQLAALLIWSLPIGSR